MSRLVSGITLDGWLEDNNFSAAFKEPLRSKLNIARIEDIANKDLSNEKINEFVDYCRSLPSPPSFVLCAKFKMRFPLFVQKHQKPSTTTKPKITPTFKRTKSKPSVSSASNASKGSKGSNVSNSSSGASSGTKSALIDWVNERLQSTNSSLRVSNLSRDLRDGKVYVLLLKSLCGGQCGDEALTWTNETKRCKQVLESAQLIGIKPKLKVWNITSGNEKLNTAFIEQLYNYKPGTTTTTLTHTTQTPAAIKISGGISADANGVDAHAMTASPASPGDGADRKEAEAAGSGDKAKQAGEVVASCGISASSVEKGDCPKAAGTAETAETSKKTAEAAEKAVTGSTAGTGGKDGANGANGASNRSDGAAGGRKVKKTKFNSKRMSFLQTLEAKGFVPNVDTRKRGITSPPTSGSCSVTTTVGSVGGVKKMGDLISSLNQKRARALSDVGRDGGKDLDLKPLVLDRPVVPKRRSRPRASRKLLESKLEGDDLTEIAFAVVKDSDASDNE